MQNVTVSRREFLQQAAVALAGAALSPAGMHAAPLTEETHGPQNGSSRVQLTPLAYNAVTLTPGLPERQRKDTVAVLFALSDDELLKPYRVRSGKDAPGKAIGGWYDAYAYCPGHTLGQWLSAFSRTAAIDDSEAMRARVRGLVAGLSDSFDAKGSFFNDDNRFPAYTLEKLNCGLIDAYQFGGDKNASDVLHRVNALAQPHLPEKALSRAEQRKRSTRDVSYSYDETYTLPENYFLAYQRTGDTYYRDLAIKFMHSSFLDPLAQGENVLPGLHAYSHLNALNSAAQAYLVTGDEKALSAAVNGFDLVQQQSFASGGWGPNEAFVTPGRGELAQSLQSTHSSFETPCGAYGHFKITRSLLSVTADGKYGDSMEAVMFNTILGSLPLQPDGRSFYYSDYNFKATKAYHGTKWPCCSGTLAQAASDYRINAYLHGSRGLYVNLYTPSTVRFEDRGVLIELQQSGDYPLDSAVHFDVRPVRSASFALSFRIPAWAGKGTRMTVNGKPLAVPSPIKGFSTVERVWSKHDRLTLDLPLALRLQPVAPETLNTVALLRGPVLLYGLGPAGNVKETDLLAALQTDQNHWTVATSTGDRVFAPFSAISDETYSPYNVVTG